MQAMLAADCINQTSLSGATLHYTNLPNSTVGRGEGRAKAVEQEAANRATIEQYSFVGCLFLHLESLCWTPHDSAAKSGHTGLMLAGLTCTECYNYASTIKKQTVTNCFTSGQLHILIAAIQFSTASLNNCPLVCGQSAVYPQDGEQLSLAIVFSGYFVMSSTNVMQADIQMLAITIISLQKE